MESDPDQEFYASPHTIAVKDGRPYGHFTPTAGFQRPMNNSTFDVDDDGNVVDDAGRVIGTVTAFRTEESPSGEPADEESVDETPTDLALGAGEPSAGGSGDGGTRDGETSDEESSDGEASDEEPSDGEASDGESSDGEARDGEARDEEPSDGQSDAGEPSDGQSDAGEPSDGGSGTGESSDREPSAGRSNGGESGDGESGGRGSPSQAPAPQFSPSEDSIEEAAMVLLSPSLKEEVVAEALGAGVALQASPSTRKVKARYALQILGFTEETAKGFDLGRGKNLYDLVLTLSKKSRLGLPFGLFQPITKDGATIGGRASRFEKTTGLLRRVSREEAARNCNQPFIPRAGA
ncbi:hypothetical protein F4803DRAFT_552307 [Xylaria telfairii]|nr:hypothetical protein F4803DRAFT_552307 [Xylaria telfairii]